MSAAYATGSATGPTDLLTKLVTFLAAQGWTADTSVSYGSGWRAHLHKGSQYVSLRALVNESASLTTALGAGGGSSTAGYGLLLYLGDGYAGANAWNNQSGGPFEVTGAYRLAVGLTLTSAAIPTYHFLDDGLGNITVVTDRGSSLTGHLGWGPSLVKTGYTNDYWYFYGSSPGYWVAANGGVGPYPGSTTSAHAPMVSAWFESSYGFNCATAFVRGDTTPRWMSNSETTNSPQVSNYTGKIMAAWCGRMAGYLEKGAREHPTVTDIFYSRSWQSAFAGALLLPIHSFYLNANALWNPLGYLPAVFLFGGVGHGFAGGQVITVGGVNYLVFSNFAVKKLA